MRLKHTVLVGILTLAATVGTMGFSLWPQSQDLESPALRWKQESDFKLNLTQRFERFSPTYYPKY
jgi:hypothetical protein